MTVIAWREDNKDRHVGVTTSGATVTIIQKLDGYFGSHWHTDFDGTTRWYRTVDEAKAAADRILEFEP